MPPAGPGRTGSLQREREREREIRALRAQPAPLARAAGGKRDVRRSLNEKKSKSQIAVEEKHLLVATQFINS